MTRVNLTKTTKDAALLRTLRQSELVSLAEIRLIESHCKLGHLRENELPETGNQTTHVGMRFDDAGNAIFVVVKYGLLIGYDEKKLESNADSAVVTIRANFGVQYKHKQDEPEKSLGDVVPRLAVMNSWPYWREFVQSMVVRMGLPAFPVPIMNLGNLIPESDQSAQRHKAKAGKR